MNRKQRKASESKGRRLQGLPWNDFKDVTDEAYYRHMSLGGNQSFSPDKVYQNNKFIVQIFKNNKTHFDKMFDKVMIRRSDAKIVTEWHDIQRLKNEIFGSETIAIQIFPKQSELVDVANMYWLWVESKCN